MPIPEFSEVVPSEVAPTEVEADPAAGVGLASSSSDEMIAAYVAPRFAMSTMESEVLGRADSDDDAWGSGWPAPDPTMQKQPPHHRAM